MGNIIIPEAALDEFLKLVLARVTKEGNELVAESRARRNADEAMFRAQFEVALERRLREAEKEIERTKRKVEQELERMKREVEQELERRLREAEKEIERTKREVEQELERKRRAAEAVEQAAVSAPPYRAAPEGGQNGGTDGPGSPAGSVDQDDLGLGSKGGFR
jgi:hypothetical protein